MKYTIPLLYELFLIWEDYNKATEFDYRIGALTKFFTAIDAEYAKTMDDYVNLPGSELSKNFRLSRPIKDYERLGVVLESGNSTELLNRNPHDFLVSIPDALAGEYTSKFDFSISNLPSMFVAPFYLTKWAEHKKVCIVKNRKLLEQYAGSVETCSFEHLPYDCFLMKVEEPFVFHKKYNEEIIHLEVAHFIVSRVDDNLHVFGIPNEIMNRSFDEDEAAILEKIIQKSKGLNLSSVIHQIKTRVGQGKNPLQLQGKMKVQAKEVKRLYEMLNEVPPNMLGRIYSSDTFLFHYMTDIATGKNSNSSFSDFHFGSNEDSHQYAEFVSQVMVTIDGMCVALMTAKSQTEELVTLVSEESPTVPSSEAGINPTSIEGVEVLEWYEVPEHSVDFFKTHKHRGSIKVSIARGSEKSPHPRRGHTRMIKNKDGGIRTVQVKKSFIHQDRLLQGVPAKSGVLIT